MIITIKGVRFIVAILAAFASFFSYVCRFNLSLAIIAMVKPQSSVTRSEMVKSITSIDGITPEEQMLAWLPPHKYYSSKNVTQDPKVAFVTSSKRILNSLMKDDITIKVDTNADPAETTTAGNNPTNTQDITEEQQDDSTSIQILPHHAEPVLLDWTDKNQDSILGAFFYGYVLAQIPATRCAEIWGAKWLYIAAGLGSGLVTLLFPWVAQNTPVASVFMARFIMGVLQSGVFPASYVLLSDWLPPIERSKWLPIPSAASRVGMIVISMLCNTIITHYNWQTVFYFSALATLIWTLIWFIVGSSRPRDNLFISRNELLYIETNLKARTELREPNTQLGINEKVFKKPIDWFKLLKSRSVWVMTLVMFGSEWSNMLLFLLMPRFFAGPLKLDLGESGFWSSMIVLLYCFNLPLTGYLSSKMLEHKFMNLTTLQIRKLFEFFAQITQALGSFMLVFVTGKAPILIALFTIILGRSSIGGGQCQLPSDLSKDHSGTIFAFGNTISNIACFAGPALFTFIVMEDYAENFGAWINLWLISTAIFLVCGILFLLFGDNECQDFSKVKNETSSSRLALDKNNELSLKATTSNPHIISTGQTKVAKDQKIDIPSDNKLSDARL